MDIDWNRFHEFTKKYDPLGHYLVDWTRKSSAGTVNKTSKLLGDAADKVGINSSLPRYWQGKSERDYSDTDHWLENTAGSAAAIYGGMSALGGSGSGTTAAGATESSAAPNALGYGMEGNAGYVNPSTGGSFGSTAAKGGLSSMNLQGLGKMFGGSGSGQQQAGNDSMSRQLALAEMMRKRQEDQDAANQMPGWVNTSPQGAYA
jgi:hypothetical protein